MKPLLPLIKKYISKYKIFRPYLKKFIKDNGYVVGYLRIFKIVIVGGLKAIYHHLISFEQHFTGQKEDVEFCQFVIFAPDFVSNSAGIYCLYKLCNDLNNKGIKAAIYGSNITTKKLNAPLISHYSIQQLKLQDDVWVIYPETIVGNPLNFKNVARWVLNRPGVLGGDEVYDSSEKVFVYSNIYMPYVKNTVHGKLCMPTFDSSIFYPPKGEEAANKRGLACYYIGKSTFKAGYFDDAETFEINRNFPPKNELGKLLRSAKVLYSFDNTTALIYEAIACGCPVQIIPDGTQTWEDYKKLEWGTTGIYWDQPAVDLKTEDVNNLLSKIKLTEDQYLLELDHFINETVGSSH